MNNLLNSFSLTIKIGTEKIKFTINTHQSTDQMFQKLKKIHPQCQNKKEETLNKLKHDLQNKLKTRNVKENIIQTIEYYLTKNFKEQQTVISKTQNQIKVDSSLLTTQNVSFKASPVNQKAVEKQQRDSKIESKSIFKKEAKEKANPRQRKVSVQRRVENVQKNKSQLKKQNMNEDLIKAYQTILQKSTQVDIKMMAKKCLQELGKLPQADRKTQPINSQKHLISLLDQKQARTQQKQLILQQQNKSPVQVFDLTSAHKQINSISVNQQTTSIAKSSERSSYPKLFVTNKYSYMPNTSFLIEQARYNGGQTSILSLRNTSGFQRKFNYLHNFV